jgi:hypothetical protein
LATNTQTFVAGKNVRVVADLEAGDESEFIGQLGTIERVLDDIVVVRLRHEPADEVGLEYWFDPGELEVLED